MVTKHLTDDEVQQYAVDKLNCENEFRNIFIYASNADRKLKCINY